MATYETVVRLQLDNKQAVQRAGQLRAETKRLNDKARKLTAQLAKQAVVSKEDAEALGVLRAQIRRNQAEMRELDNAISGTTAAGLRFRDKMASASTQALGAFGLAAGGVTTAVLALSRAVGGAVQIFADFDKALSNLAAITGLNKTALAGLSEQAKQLGSTTAFTASQVLDAQTELAKLGFTIQQVEQAVPAVLDLAAATGTDLANAATIAAKTLNGFQLSAAETARVVDVIAQSANLSAFDIDTFSAAMSNAAPAAKAVGIEIEQTAAMLSALVDAGIPAEKAGTDLRNIFIDLAAKGLTLEDAYAMITGSQEKLTTAVELFDQRAAGSAIILADQAEKVDRLSEAYEKAAGTAKQMADAQLDNLRGDQLILTSAWEGFVLSVEDGSGVISSSLRSVTKEFTDLLTALKGLNDTGSFSEAVLIAISQALPSEAGAALRAMAAAVYGADEATKGLGDNVKDLQAEYDRLTGYINAYIKEGKNEIANDLLVERAMVAAKISTLEHAKAVKLATEATEEGTDAGDENATTTERQAAAVRILTDEMRAFLKAQQDINQGVGIGQMDIIGGLTMPELDSAATLMPGTAIADNLEENLGRVNDASAEYANLFLNLSTSIGQSLGQAFQDVEDANQKVLLSILETVRSAVRLYLSMTLGREIATKGFAGIATFAALATLVEATFAAAASSIQGFAEGGIVLGEGQRRSGAVRGTDGRPIRRSNGDNMLVTAKVGELFLNDAHREAIERMLGPNVWKALGIPGFAGGGIVSNSQYTFKKGSGGLAAPRPSTQETINAELAGVTQRLAMTPIYASWTEGTRVGRRIKMTEASSSL